MYIIHTSFCLIPPYYTSQVPDKCLQLDPRSNGLSEADLMKSFSRSGLTLAATEALEAPLSLDPLTKLSHMPSIPNESTPLEDCSDCYCTRPTDLQ